MKEKDIMVFLEFTVDTIIKKRNHIYASVAKVKALNEEKILLMMRTKCVLTIN